MKIKFLNSFLSRGVATLLVASGLGAAYAADPFPTKPIRIIVPAAPGGSLDLTTRLVAQKMGEQLGQTVLVDNKPGGDTLVGTRFVKDAPADGYTILATANGFSLLPQMKLDPGYDPLKDFTGIGFMVRSPMLLEVGADQPDRTLADFIARAKASPGKLNFANAGMGSPPHIAAAGFLHAAGLNVTGIPYKGNGQALPDVVSGRIEMIVDGYISSSSFIKAGKLRPLAVSSGTRIAPLPDVPTFQEQGVNYTYTLWLGLVARSGTPKEIVDKLAEAVRFATSSKELNDRFRSEGSDPSYMAPAAFNDYLVKEVGQMAKVASDLKLPKE